MSRARNLADLLDSNGDVVSGALDNVPAINSSAVTTALGYTPVNKAGDTMTGNLDLTSLNVQGAQKRIRTWEWNGATLNQNSTYNLVYNSSSYADVQFILTLEGFHSGRSYAMYAGVFGGYGAQFQLIGGSTACTISQAPQGTGTAYLTANTTGLTGGSGSFSIHMTIFGDAPVTAVNGAFA